MSRPHATPSVLGLVLLGAVGGCAPTARVAVPAPSELSGAHWWTGTAFDDAPRYVAEGRFHAPGGAVSERVPLPPLFAVPLAPGDCTRRPVVPTEPFPTARALVPGQPADFYLTATDPRVEVSPPAAFVCGGQLVDDP